MIGALLATLFFSISAVSGTRCARALGGVEANFWRLSVAGLLLGLYVVLRQKTFAPEAFWMFVLSGFIGIGLGDSAFFQTLPRLGARLTVLLIQCLSVPMAALIEWLWLGTRLSLTQITCSSIILTGVALALSPKGAASQPQPNRTLGITFGLLAALANSVGVVLTRRAFQLVQDSGSDVDPPTAACQRVLGGLFIGGLIMLAVKWPAFRKRYELITADSTHEHLKNKWGTIWGWLIVNALAGQTFGVSCFQWALKTAQAGVVLSILATTPLVTIPIAWLVDGERPCLRSLVGGLIAVGGVIALILATH